MRDQRCRHAIRRPDPELAEALIAGAQAGPETVEKLAKLGGPPESGSLSGMHYFDSNTSYFGVGTIDAPAWRIDDRTKAYATRAAAARAGLRASASERLGHAWSVPRWTTTSSAVSRT